MSTERLVREARPMDLARIAEIYNYAVRETTATADTQPTTTAARTAWLEERRQLGLPVLVAQEGAQVIGWASLNPYSPKPGYRFTGDLSIYVDAPWQRQGVGRMLLTRIIEEARAKGLHAIIASIDALNEASIRLHQEFGFAECGRYRELFFKFEKWLDVVHMELLL